MDKKLYLATLVVFGIMDTTRTILTVSIVIASIALIYIWYNQNPNLKAKLGLTSNNPNHNEASEDVCVTNYTTNTVLPPELSDMSNDQLSTLMTEKYQKPLEYRDTRALLAEPDPDPLLFDKDVRDPITFNYERNISGPWKQPNQDSGDYIRGDLPIAPRQSAWEDKWFNSRYGPCNLRYGALSDYFSLNGWGQEAIYTQDPVTGSCRS